MDAGTIRRLGRPGDLGWVVLAHGELYPPEFGFDLRFEATVARIVADFAATSEPARSAGWIAELAGHRVGCVLCSPADTGGTDTAQLRTLLVHPDARGRALGVRLTAECLRFARATGFRRVRLWTVDRCVAARHVYLAAGFVLVDEAPFAGFGPDLVGQTYELDLTSTPHGSSADGPARQPGSASPSVR